MLDGNFGENDRPGVDEQYLTASVTSNLRVGNDSNIRTPGDLVAAAGMNKHRMGLALRRLLTEWDKSAKPPTPTAAQIDALAATFPKEPKGSEHAGMVREESDGRTTYRRPHAVAWEQAQHWYRHELGLLMQSLKSLGTVRAGLVYHYPDPDVVAGVLVWWLAPTCPHCGGRQKRTIAGTQHLSATDCRPCRGTGLRDTPHGSEGEHVYGYMRGCLTAASRDLREGSRLRDRTPANTQGREDADNANKRRAFDESKCETKVDAEEIQAIYAMGKNKFTRQS
jgi:hypothetical protein